MTDRAELAKPPMRDGYLKMMRAHVDEGGQLSHNNGCDLLAEVERLRATALSAEGGASVPNGWKIVPEKPTPKMLEAGFSPFMAAHDLMFVKNEPCGPIYKAMVAAAPSAPLPQAPGEEGLREILASEFPECSAAQMAISQGSSIPIPFDIALAAMRRVVSPSADLVAAAKALNAGNLLRSQCDNSSEWAQELERRLDVFDAALRSAGGE